jgi:hypothetical protein
LYREQSDTQSRAIDLRHTIDPGFVNRRLVQTVIGSGGIKLVDQLISQIPRMPDGLYEARIDHAYSQVTLGFCEVLPAKTLGQLLASGNGHLFCSTEDFQPCPNVYDSARVETIISPPGNAEYSVVLEYSTEHVRSDTLRMELHSGAKLSVVARFRRRDGNTLCFHPLVMGAPWMSHENEQIANWAMWHGLDHFENFIEDFDEFNKVCAVPKPMDVGPMKSVSELAFKSCLAKILGDATKQDWGGEMSDHFTSQLHLKGRRVTGAFLLKGPSQFRPMTLNHLGKNNDQIFRLSQEPADVLFVQHCHEIETAVRATLRAFAVQPGRPRRYCLVDGRDSLWLLQAYGLYKEALALSEKSG